MSEKTIKLEGIATIAYLEKKEFTVYSVGNAL